MTLQAPSPHQQPISEPTPSASAGKTQQSFSGALPKRISHSLSRDLVKIGSLPLPAEKRKSPPEEVAAKRGLGRHALESPQKRQQKGGILTRGVDELPLQPQKSSPTPVTRPAPTRPTDSRDSFLGLLNPGHPVLSGYFPGDLDLLDRGRLTPDGARATNECAPGKYQGGETSNRSRRGRGSNKEDEGAAEGVHPEVALGAAYRGLSDPGEVGLGCPIPDTLFLPRQRSSLRGAAVPRCRGLDSADSSPQSALDLLPGLGQGDEHFTGGWASSLLSSEGGQQEMHPCAAPTEKTWQESGSQALQLNMESSPTGFLGVPAGAEFPPPSEESIKDFLRHWKANADKRGLDESPVTCGRIAAASPATSANSATRGVLHVPTLRTEPFEVMRMLRSSPVLQPPASGWQQPLDPGCHWGIDPADRQGMTPDPRAQPPSFGITTWQNSNLPGGLLNRLDVGFSRQPQRLAALPWEAYLYPQYFDVGNVAPSNCQRSTDQILLPLENHWRLDANDPLVGFPGVQASLEDPFEVGESDSQSCGEAKAERLSIARTLPSVYLSQPSGTTMRNPAVDHSAPLRPGGIARPIQAYPDLQATLSRIPDLPRIGDHLVVCRSNTTTPALLPSILSREHLNQLPFIAPAPTFQFFQSDRPTHWPVHQAAALPFPLQQGDLPGLSRDVYRP